MSELDDILMGLGAEPVPAALAGLDGPVMAGLGLRREQRLGRRTLALAGGVALLVGLAGGLDPAGRTRSEPLLAMPAAAPSHLLVD